VNRRREYIVVQRGEESTDRKRRENVGLELGPHFILILGFLGLMVTPIVFSPF
jgi:hypothetical protein